MGKGLSTRRLPLLHTTILCACAFAPLPAYANPQGASVSGGSATVSSSGNTLTVQQTSDRAIIDWNSFDVNPNETTQFRQPSSASVALNRIHDTKPSDIEGSLTANGNVILVNPNGVMFGKDSHVNVNSLVVTSADVDNSAFMAGGKLKFTHPGNPNAQIIAQGNVTVADAGLVGLVAPHVENQGTITARLGKVQLASGDGFTLDLAGDGLSEVTASDAMIAQLVKNSGIISADGGSITLTAAAARNVVDALVVNTGTLKADTFRQVGGEIILSASNGAATNSGSIQARGTNAGDSGGSVAMSAKTVQQNGAIDVSGQNAGGSVNIAFGNSYSDTSSSTVTANGASGNGGNINIVADDTPDSLLTASGDYEATSALSQGGGIDFYAYRVAIRGGRLETRGGRSGGRTTVGFDPLTGRRSEELLIDQAASLNADGAGGIGGSITLAAASVEMQGSASAQGLTQGGSINVSFDDSYTDTASTILTAASTAGPGGEIHLEGGGGASLYASGSYLADGATTGGAIDMLSGNDVMLIGALLSTLGGNGGGYIRVGGDFHGAGDAEHSQYTLIDGNTRILADATNNGNGGDVVVWSDRQTLFYGTISAQGGPNGGNGGYVETSSHNLLVPDGMVYANAPKGQGGQWLLDPADITISGGSDSGITGNPNFIPDGSVAESVINVSDITTALNAGTNVTITTGGDSASGSNNGQITVSSAITATGAGSLTLSAYSNVVVNSAITLNGGNLTLRANNSGSGSGYIDITANITTQGGSFTAGGGSGTITAGTLNADGTVNTAASGFAVGNSGNPGINIAAAISTGSGNIIINGKNSGSLYTAVEFYSGSSLSTGTGKINISGVGTGTNSGGFVLAYGSGITTTSGDITITASSAGTNAMGLGAHITTTSGNIIINGTTGSGIGIDQGDSATISGATITLYGAGGTGSGENAVGVYVGGEITSPGAITITSTASSGYGFAIDNNNDSGYIDATGSGSVTIKGYSSGGSYGFYNDSATIGDTSDTGSITLIANKIDFLHGYATPVIKTSGNITIEPYSSGTSVGIGTGTGTLSLTSTYLGYLTYGSLTIGDTTNTSALDFNDSSTFSKPLTLLSSGNVTLDSTVKDSAAGGSGPSVLIAAGGNFVNNVGSNPISLTGGSSPNWVIYSTSASSDTSGQGTTGLSAAQIKYNETYPAESGDTANTWVYSSAAAYTWTGAISTVWDVATNWSTDSVPISTGNVIIASVTNEPVLDVNAAVHNLTMNSGSTLNLAGYTLTVDGTLSATSATIKSTSGNLKIVTDALSLDSNSKFTGSGNLIIAPLNTADTIGINGASGTLTINSTALADIQSGFSGITIGGGTGYSGNINVTDYSWNAPITYANGSGTVTVSNSGSMTVGENLTTTGTGMLYLDAAGNITVSNAITTSGGGGVTLDANDTGSGSGAIVMNSGSSIASNGGNITLGGGTDPTVDAAVGDASNPAGIRMNNAASLSAGGGNISLIGSSASSYGIYFFSSGTADSISTSGSGTVTINGTSTGGSGNAGIALGHINISSVNGDIDITGATGTEYRAGVAFDGTNTVATTGSGNISFTGTQGGSNYDISTTGTNTIGGGSDNGNITFNANTITFGTGTSVQSLQNVIFAPRTSGTTVDVGGTSNGTLGITDSLLSTITAGSITIGDAANAGNMDIETSDTLTAPITFLSHGNITMGHNLADTSSTVNAIVIDSQNGNFINSGNYSITTANSNYLLYLHTAGTNTLGGVTGTAYYGKTYASNPPSGFSADSLIYDGGGSITVTADAQSATYGDAVPTLTYTCTGTGCGSLTGTLTTANGGAGTTISSANGFNAGTYTITEGSLADSGYTIVYNSANLTVGSKSITITADDKTKYYGDVNPTLTYSCSGLAGGDTCGVGGSGIFSAAPTLSTLAAQSSSVAGGPYAINASGGTPANSNYTISGYTGGLLTINPAILTLTANDAARAYGTPNSFTVSYSGWKNGDTAASLAGTPGFSTSAAQGSNVGTYTVTPTSGTLSSANYSFAFAPGTLTIDKANLTVTPDNLSKTYGTANPTLTGSLIGLYAPDGISAAYTTSATQRSDVGSYAITATTLSDPLNRLSNYNLSYQTGTLTISPAALIVQADNKSKNVYDPNPPLTLTYTGLLPWDSSSVFTGYALTTTATQTSPQGYYPINVAGGSAANYTVTRYAGVLTVAIPPLPETVISSSTGASASYAPFTDAGISLLSGGSSPDAFFKQNNDEKASFGGNASESSDISFSTNCLPTDNKNFHCQVLPAFHAGAPHPSLLHTFFKLPFSDPASFSLR